MNLIAENKFGLQNSFYERRGYRLTHKKFPFPQHRGVGVPLIDNLQVVVLEEII